jgi:chromosome partitioning protein
VLASFDFVIVDCPPSLGLLTINALVAADRVLVPLQCEFYALEGLTHLLKTVKLVQERLNPSLAVEGIVLTMFDGRTSLALQIREEVNRYFPGQVFDTVIPRNIRLTEAPSHGKPVMLHDVRSTGSTAYLDLTREVLGMINRRGLGRGLGALLSSEPSKPNRFLSADRKHRGQPQSAKKSV